MWWWSRARKLPDFVAGVYGYECSACDVKSRLSPLMHAWVSGVPHSAAGHTHCYCTHALYHCEACDQIQFELYDHDCFSRDESWEMCFRYIVRPDFEIAVRALIAACPSPSESHCECSSHLALREQLPSIVMIKRLRYF